MSTPQLPHDCVVLALRSSGIPGFDWGTQPYYKQAQEGQNQFPYCVYDVPPSDPNFTFEGAYKEVFEIVVKVSCQVPPSGGPFDIGTISSPYGDKTKSVFAFLDSYIQNPQALQQGAPFTVNGWIRGPFEIEMEEPRGPNTMRVYIASATYKMMVTPNLPS